MVTRYVSIRHERFVLSRKFSEEFLSTFAGQKIPKEGTCFDYFYDWQSDGFMDWATKVHVKVNNEEPATKLRIAPGVCLSHNCPALT